MSSIYADTVAKEIMLELYHKKLESLNSQLELRTIETSFGATNVILTGNPAGLPLLLIHSWNACAPLAIEAYAGLLDDFKLYAVDVIGQPNLSAPSQLKVHGEAYGQWIYELISFMNLQSVHLVGESFGAFICWKALLHDARHIKQAFFINPMGIVAPRRWRKLLSLQVPTFLFSRWLGSTFEKHFYHTWYTQVDAFAINWTRQLFRQRRIDFEDLPLISATQAQRITNPIYLIAAELDALFPSRAVLERSESIFPSYQAGMCLKNSKHIPDAGGYQQIISFVKQHTL